jgi:hypothetical protein
MGAMLWRLIHLGAAEVEEAHLEGCKSMCSLVRLRLGPQVSSRAWPHLVKCSSASLEFGVRTLDGLEIHSGKFRV